MFGSGMNLITTIIGFGMSATFIVFVCTRLICGRFRNDETRRMLDIESRIDLGQPEHYRNTGLQPVVVAAIPTMKFDREAFGSEEDATCTICLEEYQQKEVIRMLPQCGHNFHVSCIDIWLRKQSTCPVCRLPLHDTLDIKHTTRSESGPTPPSTDVHSEIEISVDHSQQWLLPIGDRSESNGGESRSITNNSGSVSENQEIVTSVEAEAR